MLCTLRLLFSCPQPLHFLVWCCTVSSRESIDIFSTCSLADVVSVSGATGFHCPCPSVRSLVSLLRCFAFYEVLFLRLSPNRYMVFSLMETSSMRPFSAFISFILSLTFSFSCIMSCSLPVICGKFLDCLGANSWLMYWCLCDMFICSWQFTCLLKSLITRSSQCPALSMDELVVSRHWLTLRSDVVCHIHISQHSSLTAVFGSASPLLFAIWLCFPALGDFICLANSLSACAKTHYKEKRLLLPTREAISESRSNQDGQWYISDILHRTSGESP